MPDTAKIIKAINDMHKAVDDSFEKAYAEINSCDNRITEIETTLAVKKALCKERKEKEKTQRDFWKPAIRTITIAGVLALLTLAWTKIKAILDLVQ